MTYWIGRIEPSMWMEGPWWHEVLPEDVRILGALSPIVTITDFAVAPFVGAIPQPYSFRPAEAEIAEANGSNRVRLTPYQKLLILDVADDQVEQLRELHHLVVAPSHEEGRVLHKLLEKVKSNMQEVRARGGELIVFADPDGDVTDPAARAAIDETDRRRAILRAVSALTERDEFGVVAFNENAHWAVRTGPIDFGALGASLGLVLSVLIGGDYTRVRGNGLQQFLRYYVPQNGPFTALEAAFESGLGFDAAAGTAGDRRARCRVTEQEPGVAGGLHGRGARQEPQRVAVATSTSSRRVV